MKQWQKILAIIALVLPITMTGFQTQTVHAAKAEKQYLLVMGHGAGDAGARGNGTTEATAVRKYLYLN